MNTVKMQSQKLPRRRLEVPNIGCRQKRVEVKRTRDRERLEPL